MPSSNVRLLTMLCVLIAAASAAGPVCRLASMLGVSIPEKVAWALAHIPLPFGPPTWFAYGGAAILLAQLAALAEGDSGGTYVASAIALGGIIAALVSILMQ